MLQRAAGSGSRMSQIKSTVMEELMQHAHGSNAVCTNTDGACAVRAGADTAQSAQQWIESALVHLDVESAADVKDFLNVQSLIVQA